MEHRLEMTLRFPVNPMSGHPKPCRGANLPLLLMMVWLVGLTGVGCGVKSPPMPPPQLPLPAVLDLAYQVAGPTATLTWRLAGPLSGRQASRGSFIVYRSRSTFEQPACEGCPLVFEKVATVPYTDSEGNRFAIDVPLDSGYRYVFKVRLETDQSVGPDSGPVQFDHSAETSSAPLEKP